MARHFLGLDTGGMSIEVKIPAVGESISSGVVSVWHKKSGDQVDAGEALFTLETDKVSTEIVAEKAGVLETLVPEGQEVKIGEVVATIDDSKAAPAKSAPAEEKTASAPDEAKQPAPHPTGRMLSGTATAVKRLRPEAKVFGVEPELAGDTAQSFRTGEIVTWSAEMTSRTIADGLRTQSVGVRNFAHIQAFVDGVITVTEAEIRAAMRAIVAVARLVPEPSGAVAAAALLFHAAELPPYRKAVAVVSGGNVDPALLAEVLTESQP